MRQLLLALTISSFAMQSLAAEKRSVQNDALIEQQKPENILVYGTRGSQNLAEATRTISITDREAIELFKPKSIAEAVAFEPNVNIQGGPRAGLQTVNIRGLDQNKVLQVVDGVRVEFESGHRPSYFLDPELISSIQTIKGPTSSLWGSGALGGVVAQNTVSPSELLTKGGSVGGFVKSQYQDNGEQMTTTLAVAGEVKNIGWLISGYKRDFNDIELGNGQDLEDSGSNSRGILGKVEWVLSDSYEIGFNFRSSDDESTVPNNGTAVVDGRSVFPVFRDTEYRQVSFDNRYNPENKLIDARVLLYSSIIDVEETKVSDGRFDTTEKDTIGFNLTNVSTFDGFTILYGLDGFDETFEPERGGSNRPIIADADISVLGAFIQSNIDLTDRVGIEIGGRFDSFETDADNAPADVKSSRDYTEFSPSLAFVTKVNDNLRIILRRDEAFRAPTAEELYVVGTHFCLGPFFCNEFIANPNLEPERAVNKELIISSLDNTLANGGNIDMSFRYFENDVKDFIEQITYDPITFSGFTVDQFTTWLNVDSAELTGFEFDSSYTKDKLKLSVAYGETRGKDKRGGDALAQIPADKWVFNAAYLFESTDITTGVRLTHVKDQDKVPVDNAVQNYDGYTLTDLYGSWQPSSALLEGLSLDVTVKNLADKYYRVAFEELFEAGREVRVSATYKF